MYNIKDCPNQTESISFMKKIPSNKLLIPEISNDFLNWLHLNEVKECDALQIAFEEALTNAIVHGNKNDHSKNVYITFYIDEEKIEISIEDEGSGFDYSLAIIELTESQENIYKDSGRGIFLISLYTDDFYYEDNGRKIIMVKYRN